MRYCSSFLLALALLGTGCSRTPTYKKPPICFTAAVATVVEIQNKREDPNNQKTYLGDLTLKTDDGKLFEAKDMPLTDEFALGKKIKVYLRCK